MEEKNIMIPYSHYSNNLAIMKVNYIFQSLGSKYATFDLFKAEKKIEEVTANLALTMILEPEMMHHLIAKMNKK